MTKEELIARFEEETGNNLGHVCNAPTAYIMAEQEKNYWRDLAYWLIERDAKKDAEIERLINEVGKFEHAFLIADGWVTALQAKMDKAQTCIMYDVDAGHLSFERDSRHNREVEVLLMEVEESK